MINKIEVQSRKIELVKKLNTLYKYCDILEEAIKEINPPLLTSLSRKVDEDLVDYLLFLKKDKTLVTKEEIDFINKVLGFSFSGGRLNNRKRLVDNKEDIILPVVLCIAVDVENTMDGKNDLIITKLICEIYVEIGTLFLSLNSNRLLDLNESSEKLQNYEDILINFINKRINGE